MIEADLYSHLSTYAGLTALVSARLYPIEAPQGVVVPYCVYHTISISRQYSHGGYSGLDRVRIQISCYGGSAIQARQVSEQAVAAMEAWPAANSKVQASQQENETDLYHDSVKLHQRAVDFFIWYG